MAVMMAWVAPAVMVISVLFQVVGAPCSASILAGHGFAQQEHAGHGRVLVVPACMAR